MSFDFPQQPKRRKGGMNGIMMLLIIGAALFFFMQSRDAPNPGAGQNGNIVLPGNGSSQSSDPEITEDDSYRRQRDEILGAKDGKRMPTGKSANNGEWSIQDVDSGKGTAKVVGKDSGVTKTKGKDGWSIEEVPTKKKSDNGFNLKNASKGDVKPAVKSDWSIDDVDSKNKKTKEGDWTLEEVDKKRDK